MYVSFYLKFYTLLQLKKMDTASKQSEPKSIPGLGNSESVSGKSVPSFLRTVENQPVTKPPLTNANTFVKKIRELPPSTSSTDKPERDLLKSIREQAQKLQEQLTSGVDNTHSGTQPGIQSQSQFVHGQSTFSAYSHSWSFTFWRTRLLCMKARVHIWSLKHSQPYISG